ncbi:MAG: UDP-4-amino-4,6-dideoxy-N-acetyl-beta-L-altrosamine transaminase [Candidatus Thermoplasmatota archaeon]|nr:UDP-4-amino-4,6-dideoxy-N-acetyl-beta-L-altrosamine transaminase [Candidatus Thermoplasmatota archaeon]
MSGKLAIHGGTPVRKTLLPYGHQSINQDDINAVASVLKTDWITQGPLVSEFEQRIATYCHVKYAVALSSGTAALHAAAFAVGLSHGDELITTPITFVADGNCAFYQGGTVRLADVHPDTVNIDPSCIGKALTSKTKALLPVDFAGHPCDLDDIKEIAADHSVPVIEDAAHALGAEYKGKKVGGLADISILSFHPVKAITTGEGGMVLTNNSQYYDRLTLFRTHGITKDATKMHHQNDPWYYEMQHLGYNYRLTDMQCALGISQLKKLDTFIARRRALVSHYNTAFHDNPTLITPTEKKDVRSAYHLYVLQLQLEHLTVDRATIFQALRAENIGINVHYIPLHYQPYYQRTLSYRKGDFPIAERYYDRTITLPLFPQMTDEDADDVIEAVQKVIHAYRRD